MRETNNHSAKHAASGTSSNREVLEILERTSRDPHRKRRYTYSVRVVPTWGECTTEDIREAIQTFEGVDIKSALKRINGVLR